MATPDLQVQSLGECKGLGVLGLRTFGVLGFRVLGFVGFRGLGL